MVHTDIYGLITLKSFSEKGYFIIFINNYTRKTWVCFFMEKSKAFEVFQKFKVMMEKTTYFYIEALWSDKGQEYMSIHFHIILWETRYPNLFHTRNTLPWRIFPKSHHNEKSKCYNLTYKCNNPRTTTIQHN